jgi:hypothetical protein
MFPGLPRDLLPQDSSRCRHTLPAGWLHPESRSTYSGLPRNIVNNTRNFRVGRSEKIGIIGLDVLKALAAWISARKTNTVNGVDSCNKRLIEASLPPAPVTGTSLSGSTVDSGDRSADAGANSQDPRPARRGYSCKPEEQSRDSGSHSTSTEKGKSQHRTRRTSGKGGRS